MNRRELLAAGVGAGLALAGGTIPARPANAYENLVVQANRQAPPMMPLADFVRGAWPILEPGIPLLWNWHHDAICAHLEAVTDGRIRRLVINAPPASLTSTIVSVCWPAWEWVDQPERRTIRASYDTRLGQRDIGKMFQVVSSDWYHDRTGSDWSFKRDQHSRIAKMNDRQGQVIAVGSTGPITGWRGDAIVADRPLDDAHWADQVRQEELAWAWRTKFATRVNDPKTGVFVVAEPRVAQFDLSGDCLFGNFYRPHHERRGHYDHLCLMTEWDPDIAASPTSLGWTDPRYIKGDLIHPRAFPRRVVESIKGEIGPRAFAASHQQRPIAQTSRQSNPAPATRA